MAERSELIHSDIEQTRSEMGDTLDALGYKVNVPARTRSWMGRRREAVTGACGTGITKVSGAADSLVSRVSGTTPSSAEVRADAGRLKDTGERNPLGLALAGAAAGFLAGLFAPSTRVEDEKLGPVADQVKSSAVEAGKEAIEQGKQVAHAAGESAVETARTEGRQSSEQLAASLQEKARAVSPTSEY